MKIHEIREQKAKVVHQMRQLVAVAEEEKRELSTEEVEKFAKMKVEVESLESKEERAQFLDQQAKGQPADKSFQALEGNVTVLDALQAQLNGGATGALREFNRETEIRTGKKAQGIYVPLRAFEARDTQTTKTATGIVPTDYFANEFIGPLRHSLLMRTLGIRTMTGLRGDVVIPKYKTGMKAGWVEENEALTKSGGSFENVEMKPKHVGALTELSRQLIQQSSPDINSLVTDDISFVMADALDQAILSGDGVKQPLGILETVGIQKGSLANPDWESVLKLTELLDVRNVENAKFITNPSSLRVLRAIEKSKGTGQYLATNNTIGDTSALVTNQMGGKGLLLGDFSQYILGVWSEVDLMVNPYAESAYNKGNILVRAMMTAGTACRHPEAFVHVDDLPEGATE